MTPEELAEIEGRLDAVTEGPWKSTIRAYMSAVGPYCGGSIQGVCDEYHDGHGYAAPLSQADAEFIAHARSDVPALIAELKRCQAVIAAVEDVAKWRPGAESLVFKSEVRAVLAGTTTESGE